MAIMPIMNLSNYLIGLTAEEREAHRLGKRLRWLAHQLEEYPVPVGYLIRFNCAPWSIDITVEKRRWTAMSQQWQDRRREAYGAYVAETE